MNMITIRPIENRKRHYLAYFKDDFLQAVYSVAFTDSITGAMSLNRFFVMINMMYEGQKTDVRFKAGGIKFKSQAVLDTLTGKKKEVQS